MTWAKTLLHRSFLELFKMVVEAKKVWILAVFEPLWLFSPNFWPPKSPKNHCISKIIYFMRKVSPCIGLGTYARKNYYLSPKVGQIGPKSSQLLNKVALKLISRTLHRNSKMFLRSTIVNKIFWLVLYVQRLSSLQFSCKLAKIVSLQKLVINVKLDARTFLWNDLWP